MSMFWSPPPDQHSPLPLTGMPAWPQRSFAVVPPSIETETEALGQLDALAAHMAILDAAGTIVAINKGWQSFDCAGAMPDRNTPPGSNYLRACETMSGAAARDAAIVAQAIRDVIEGRYSSVYYKYGCPGAADKRLFSVRISRLRHAEPMRIVVAHQRIF